MEPLVARMVLPLYGGSFHVWSTTLTFFQGILFIGYVYCHFFAKRLGGWHLVLVATPLAWLPLANWIGLAPPGDSDPAWSLLFQLTLHIALPFGILATTSDRPVLVYPERHQREFPLPLIRQLQLRLPPGAPSLHYAIRASLRFKRPAEPLVRGIFGLCRAGLALLANDGLEP